jgi:hypothetical protein
LFIFFGYAQLPIILGRSTVGEGNLKLAMMDDRRSRRTDMSAAAMIEAGPGRAFAVTVHNVSAHGLMVEVDARFVPGRPVTVDMAGLGRVSGRVAWVREGHAGIAFGEPLTLDQISAIL